MADYISRKAAINIVCHDECDDCPDGGCDMYRRMKHLPAANVRPVAEVDSLVDKATLVLNDFYTSMPYEVYCKILYAVEDIYSMNKKKEDKHD